MGHFWTASLFGLDVHMNTVIMVWLTMLVLLVFAKLTTQSLKVVPSTGQMVGESFYDFCRSITMATAGPKGDGYLFFIGSMFLFILTANLMGQLPLRLFDGLIPAGSFMAATGDINTTSALAVLSLLMYIAMAIKRTGLSGFFKHHLYPSPLFLPLNLLEHITRPGSLLIRLYFNILVGEILSALALKTIPWVAPMAVIGLELFVAVVQAYIFAILSAVYIALMVEEHDEHH